MALALQRVVRAVGGGLRGFRGLCSVQGTVSVEDERVQELLGRMSGMDMDVVFAPRRESLIPPRYKTMTRDELKEAHARAVSEAKQLLQMTPILPEREPKGATLRNDKDLEGFLENHMIFTDISTKEENKDRQVVVREASGVLREATWEERDRMMQVYFPSLGRRMWLPHMLTEEGLGPAMNAGRYRDILDVTCLQCQPDSQDYLRVHHAVYDNIEMEREYHSLRSTQHFGGLVWYLVQQERVVGLVGDMVDKSLWLDGECLVELYLLCHPQSTLATSGECPPPADKTLLEGFCRHFSLEELLTLLPSDSQETDQALAT